MASSTAGGGTSLANIATRMLTTIRSAVYRSPKDTIAGNDQAGWPSALQPIKPIAPADSQPLGFSYWQGVNQDITPRLDAPITFPELRNLATYPLARICIENVKDILCTMPWKIQLKRIAGEPVADWKGRQKKDTNVQALTEFFQYPDGETPWSDWLRPVIEDMLVIDAPSILMQRNLAGKVVSLRWTDGANILRLITDQGFTPQGDSPAYTQLWEGIPYLLFTTRQLVYRPSNIAAGNSYASKIYGRGITEQLAQEIIVGQERLNFVTAFYKEGITGGLIHVVPAGISPDKVSENTQAMNALMAGNLGQRRRWNITQGYYPVDGPHQEQIIQTKEPVLADIFDDLHIRKLAFGYGVSAQRLTKALNRASADANQDASEKEGIMPRLKWLKGTMDLIIQVQMGNPQYEMIFDTDNELDAVKQSTVDKTNVESGLRTLDEVREDRGLVAYNIPESKEPIIVTATGVQPLAGSFDRVQQAADNDTAVANKPTPAPVVSAAGNKVIRDWYATRY